jgi:hypothetical protein
MATVSYSSRGEKMGLEKQTSKNKRRSRRYDRGLFDGGQWGQKIRGEGTITDTRGEKEREGRLQGLFKKNS